MSTPEAPAGRPVAVVGDDDAVMGFRAMGFAVYGVTGQDSLAPVLAEVVRGGAGVCLVQEDLYRAHKEAIDGYRHVPLPVFVPFPAGTGDTDFFGELLSAIRLKATGKL